MHLLLRVALLTLVVHAPLQAQRTAPPAIDKGSKVLSGGASLSRIRSEADAAGSVGSRTTTTTQLSLAPSLLYFVAPGVALGGSAEFGWNSSGSVSSTAVGVGPTARLYFANAQSTALPYVGANARLARVSFDYDNGSDPSSTQWAVEGVAGITWLLSRQVGILGEAFLTRSELSAEALSGVSTDASETAFGVRFGVAAFLPRGR